jgi:hypothetical protein
VALVHVGGILLAALVASGCARVTGSAVATGPRLPPLAEGEAVRISALRVPDGAQGVGLVQAQGVGSLDEILAEFVHQVQQVGGNWGKVDSIRTRFEWQSQTQTYTYSCGSPQAPMTCTGTHVVNVEVSRTSVVGRAFRTEGS